MKQFEMKFESMEDFLFAHNNGLIDQSINKITIMMPIVFAVPRFIDVNCKISLDNKETVR